MRVWFDTEFYNPHGPELTLISIGLVNEIGDKIHLVNADAPYDKIADTFFLATEVLPHLGDQRDWLPYSELAERVQTYLFHTHTAGSPRNLELWGYMAAFDHVLLSKMFGPFSDHPLWLPWHTNDVAQLVKHHNIGPHRLPDHHEAAHHALSDAEWIRDAHLWLENETKTQGA